MREVIMSSSIPPGPLPEKDKNELNKVPPVLKTEETQKDNEEKFENFFSQASANTRDIIAYVLMILGIILLFVNHMYGGFIIGLVAGVYFSKEIVDLIQNFENFIDEQGLARSIILGGTLLSLFILAPSIFIGIAVVILLRMFIFSESK
jgi:hypothetical protein